MERRSVLGFLFGCLRAVRWLQSAAKHAAANGREVLATGKGKFAQGIFIRLFRAWSAQTEMFVSPYPRMLELVSLVGLPAEAAVAAGSLFELVESHLGRRLEPECCCSQVLTVDEQALLGLLEFAPRIDSVRADQSIPHGLPGAITFAAITLRRHLGMSEPADALRTAAACSFPQPGREISCGV